MVIVVSIQTVSTREVGGRTALGAWVGYIVQQLRCDDGITELFEEAMVLGPAELSVPCTLWDESIGVVGEGGRDTDGAIVMEAGNGAL